MIWYIIAGIFILLVLAVILFFWWKTARTIRRLDDMLTAATDGTFSEQTFDESRLSALESRLARYLAASALSERNVREQKDQISALISDISHQTKTPVANLQLYAQLLSEQPLTPQGKDCAAAISAQADKLQTLIEALVKTSRLETGILTLHPQSGEIAPMLERAIAQYGPKASEKDITLTARQTEGSAVFDPKWTEEAVCNLLDNAVKFASPQGLLTLKIKPRAGKAYIAIGNQGETIPPQQLTHIFDRFHKADSSRSTHKDGVGLGLYIVKTILNTYKEDITVTSQDGFTEFTFTLSEV